jgi:hypothetical protein
MQHQPAALGAARERELLGAQGRKVRAARGNRQFSGRKQGCCSSKQGGAPQL